ncbi:transposase [Ralstonia pickettii]
MLYVSNPQPFEGIGWPSSQNDCLLANSGRYRRPAWAQKAWEHWCAQARESQIPALELFAQRLQTYWHGIIARCRHPLNTSVVEGINNTIKVIKRRAYGYRDEEYFFLKIRAAFPGIPR